MEPSVAVPQASQLQASSLTREERSSANAVNECNMDTPMGYRFRPTDVELINCLTQQAKNKKRPDDVIPVADLYGNDSHPAKLAQKYPKLDNCNVWYFYTSRKKRYKNGSRPNRIADNGYWKATGADKPITDNNGVKRGYKKTLCFYEGERSKGQKTNWIMHEYLLSEKTMWNELVLCRIYHRKTKKKNDEAQHPIKRPDRAKQLREVPLQSGNTENNQNLELKSSNNAHIQLPNFSEIADVPWNEPRRIDTPHHQFQQECHYYGDVNRPIPNWHHPSSFFDFQYQEGIGAFSHSVISFETANMLQAPQTATASPTPQTAATFPTSQTAATFPIYESLNNYYGNVNRPIPNWHHPSSFSDFQYQEGAGAFSHSVISFETANMFQAPQTAATFPTSKSLNNYGDVNTPMPNCHHPLSTSDFQYQEGASAFLPPLEQLWSKSKEG